jgi:glutathione peroxidase
MSKSIYDIKIKSWDGQEDFLSNYKGKVSLIINTTADCGNAPQFGIIEKLYQTYKDLGFEVIAIPTNQYCGPKVTYGQWEDGIQSAEDSKVYAEEKYGTTYAFSEILISKPGPGAPKGLKDGEVPHELFEELIAQSQDYLMFGNFEKFLVSRDGLVVNRYPNGSLLDYAIENGVPSSEEAYKILSKDIESALNGNSNPNDGMSLLDPKFQTNLVNS